MVDSLLTKVVLGGKGGGNGRYSVSQAARIIGLSERAIRKRIDARTLDAVRQGEGPWRVALTLDSAALEVRPKRV